MSIIVGRELGEDDFDEEAVERDEFEIEKDVNDFVNEPYVRHDTIPESDDEAEKGWKMPSYEHTHVRRGDGRLYKAQTFFNGVAFKDSVLDYALRTCTNITQYRYDKRKIGFRCIGKGENNVECQWLVYASSLPNDPMWKIRKFQDHHCCTPNGDVDMFKVPQIARTFLDKIRDEPDYYMPMKIEEDIKEKWGITVSRPQCQAARTKALRWIEFEYDHQFARLRDYAAEIKGSNKDSTVMIDTLMNEEGKEEFNRMYVCFDALRTTWLSSCRPLIGVDGCFLKHKVKGQFLVALGRDADNAIYPIAWCVVRVENKDNWLWFLKMLKVDLDLKDGDGYILVSDRQKGLISAVQMELPKIEHRKCVRHIYGNLKKNHGSKKDMKPMIWNLAWSYNEAEYNERLDRIFNYDLGVYYDVVKSNPKSWCRAFYKLGNFCEDIENNSTESFNSSINKAREKPFVVMLETVRRLAMARIAKRSVISHTHDGICTPYVTKFLASEFKKASECRVSRSTNGDYEVKTSGCTYRANLEKRTCTCRKFQICGIPCEHAYAVILMKKLTPEDYVCHWFRTHMWKRNYENGLVPVRGARFWPRTNAPDIHLPVAPEVEEDEAQEKKKTKFDKKRKKGVNESPTKKVPKHKKRIMHCGICGVADHNSRFHKKTSSQASQVGAGPSQVQESQVLSQAYPSD